MSSSSIVPYLPGIPLPDIENSIRDSFIAEESSPEDETDVVSEAPPEEFPSIFTATSSAWENIKNEFQTIRTLSTLTAVFSEMRQQQFWNQILLFLRNLCQSLS